MTTQPRDTDIPGQVGDVLRAENRLREHYGATYADIDTNATESEVTVRLEFRGFESLDTALDRVTEVVRSINALPETTDVHAGVNTEGVWDRAADEMDDRPAGWVNATFSANALETSDRLEVSP